MSLTEDQKKAYREELGKMEAQTIRDSRKRLSTDDFDSLAIIGRGAFGEVICYSQRYLYLYVLLPCPLLPLSAENKCSSIVAFFLVLLLMPYSMSLYCLAKSA